MKNILKRSLPAVVLYFGAMAVFWGVGYIGADVVIPIYLPLLLTVLIGLLAKHYIAAYGLTLGVVLGLTVEYLHHLSRAGRPNMGGAFLNTSILLFCTGAGILIQALVNGKRKKNRE